MFALRDNAYTPIENSLALPVLSARAVTQFVEEGLTTQRVVWFENVKAQSDSRPFQSGEIEKK